MDKKNVIGLGVLLVFICVIAAIIYNIYFMEKEETDENKDDTSQQTYDNLDLKYEYMGENRWEYTVTGTLPNPCYIIKTESIVMESYPEQVMIKSTITPPDAEMICVQVIEEVLEQGEFEASEFATVSFKVE